MKKKQLMALLMVGMLGMNASVPLAETRDITPSTDWYYVRVDAPTNRPIYAEGYYYTSNSFEGATIWDYSGEDVIVEAQTLRASPDPSEGNYCFAEKDYAIGEELAVINESAFPNITAGWYHTTGVIFTHYYQISGQDPVEVYSETVKQ